MNTWIEMISKQKIHTNTGRICTDAALIFPYALNIFFFQIIKSTTTTPTTKIIIKKKERKRVYWNKNKKFSL